MEVKAIRVVLSGWEGFGPSLLLLTSSASLILVWIALMLINSKLGRVIALQERQLIQRETHHKDAAAHRASIRLALNAEKPERGGAETE